MTNDARELVRSLVAARLSALDEDQYMFGTIGEPKSSLAGVSSTHIRNRINNFVKSDGAKAAFHSAAGKAFDVVREHHKAAIAAAVMLGMRHAAHIDMPGDLEEHVAHHIEQLGTSLSISKTMAHHMLTHAVGKLKELRGIKEEVEKDDELDASLIRLHKILKKMEPNYKEEPKDQTKKVIPPKHG
jgi:hypothetical protein